MEIIKNLFETGSIILILILIFLPTITLIIQLIANIKIIKKLPEIDYKLTLLYKKLYNLEDDESKEKNKEFLKDLEQTEKNNNANEYMITTIFITLMIIFTTLIIINIK